MRVIKLLFRAIYYLFLGIAGLAAVALTVSALPIKNNFKFYVVLSGSMEPTIHTGGIVFSRPVPRYGVGDIITFTTGSKKDSVTTHRISHIKNENGGLQYQTKGDANDTPDPSFVSHNNVVGKTFFSLPYLGYLVEFTKSPRGFILFIVVPATILIYEELKSLVRIFTKPKPQTLLEELQETRSRSQYPSFVFILISLVLGTSFITAARAYFVDREIAIGNFFTGIGDPEITQPSPDASTIDAQSSSESITHTPTPDDNRTTPTPTLFSPALESDIFPSPSPSVTQPSE